MTEHETRFDAEPVRCQTFDATDPLELDLDVGLGRIDIHLREGPVVVEVRHDPTAHPSWTDGATHVLNWLGGFLGGSFGVDPDEFSPVRQVRIEEVDQRLVVHAPKAPPMHSKPLAITVYAPDSSDLVVRSRFAAITVTGTAHRADIVTSSGDVHLDQTEGPANIRTGTGEIHLNQASAGLQLRSGSGPVDVRRLFGTSTLTAGSGDVRLGKATEKTKIRSSSGNISVTPATSGTLEARSGSGHIRIGLGPGVLAQVDLSSGSGEVFSELDVETTPPQEPAALAIHARSGSGNTHVFRAGPPASDENPVPDNDPAEEA